MLGIPMCEIVDQHYDSTLFFGKEIEYITEQLYEAADTDEMIAVIEKFLLKKINCIKKSIPIEDVLGKQIQSRDMVNVNELSHQACTSVRQLERQFKERVGIPPKLFARLVRFSRAWNMRESNPDITWTKIAYACGYADQMHMIRDFKEFAGTTPSLLQGDLETSSLRLQGSAFD